MGKSTTKTPKSCVSCGQEFIPIRANQKYCGAKCRSSGHKTTPTSQDIQEIQDTATPAPPKPAPTVIGVSGFVGFTAEPAPKSFVDWSYLFGLPPFEMYLNEVVGNHNRLLHQDWLLNELKNKDEKVVYQAYADWHTAKGYWAGETPMGELLENDDEFFNPC